MEASISLCHPPQLTRGLILSSNVDNIIGV
jgi:hypothetical protein